MSGYDFAQYLDFIIFMESEADLTIGIYSNGKKTGKGKNLFDHVRKGW